MAWRCPKCGTMAEDQLEACGRCGTSNPIRAKQKADITAPMAGREQSKSQELGLAADQLVRSIDQAAREQAVAAGLAEKRQAARSAEGFARLVKAWRQHRSRIEHPSQGQRPDLDRRWIYLYLSAALLVGGATASLVYPDDVWPNWLRDNSVYLYVGVLAVSAICWRRAVRGELEDD